VRRLLIFVALVAMACSSTPSVEAFCDQAVPVLSRNDLGDDLAAWQQQMDDLASAVEHLPPDQTPELLTEIDALNAELDLALQGQAEDGWSNAEIIDTVGSLCGDDGLMEWVVLP
jgi:hypothetical protein